jgi:hypothetical protein
MAKAKNTMNMHKDINLYVGIQIYTYWRRTSTSGCKKRLCIIIMRYRYKI